MEKWVLNIGDVKAHQQQGTITCYGLGSCVGLFLYDRKNNIGGGAHIMLPGAGKEKSNTYAEQAVEDLLNQMKSLGSDLRLVRAKIIGGANLFESSMQVGIRNIESVKKLLIQKRIYIASEDLGGKNSRTGHFNLSDGILEVSSLNRKYNI